MVINISVDEYHSLLLALGYAIGAAENEYFQGASDWARMYNRRDMWLRLANAINEGNPNWTPYR